VASSETPRAIAVVPLAVQSALVTRSPWQRNRAPNATDSASACRGRPANSTGTLIQNRGRERRPTESNGAIRGRGSTFGCAAARRSQPPGAAGFDPTAVERATYSFSMSPGSSSNSTPLGTFSFSTVRVPFNLHLRPRKTGEIAADFDNMDYRIRRYRHEHPSLLIGR
jgi:hypothetical protein